MECSFGEDINSVRVTILQGKVQLDFRRDETEGGNENQDFILTQSISGEVGRVGDTMEVLRFQMTTGFSETSQERDNESD